MQAWADNLLLTARKAGALQDRRRDGSQESCTSTALPLLQQELGMGCRSAGKTPGPCSLTSCDCCGVRCEARFLAPPPS